VKRTDISDVLRRKATEVSGTITGDDFTAPPASESSLRFINQALGKLACYHAQFVRRARIGSAVEVDYAVLESRFVKVLRENRDGGQ